MAGVCHYQVPVVEVTIQMAATCEVDGHKPEDWLFRIK
jgi:hypothetical protein